MIYYGEHASLEQMDIFDELHKLNDDCTKDAASESVTLINSPLNRCVFKKISLLDFTSLKNI